MRKLTPELLDQLPHDDPGARRSRIDLRRINWVMGNERWIESVIPMDTSQITEIGAGDGMLLMRLAKKFPHAKITAMDLAPSPKELPSQVEWIQGDLFDQKELIRGGVLISNLFLHHFKDELIGELGVWMTRFDTIVINEPLRASLPKALGILATPLIHPITRHDMKVSIEAGFRMGEMIALLGLPSSQFKVTESTDLRGAIRMVASRL